MTGDITRRGLLAGVSALAASAAMAEGPAVSLRPMARRAEASPKPTATPPQARMAAAEIIAASGLGGEVGFVIADAETGEVLEAVAPTLPLPPASVTKAVTALYAIESLGPNFRFETTVMGTASVVDGVLEGDLILAGGGDPNLVTDDLAALAERLHATGLRKVTGRFLVWGDALAEVTEIDAGQLDHLGYNPSVSGLNLNFNRVHFEWKREGADYAISMDARSEKHRPAVTTARMRLVDRASPVYAYADGDGFDDWTVARGALNANGSRWLPVRYPARYTGEVFGVFAKGLGIELPNAERVLELPAAQDIVVHQSAPLRDVMRAMMRFSTNITAEAAGMTATMMATGQQRGLRTSALSMTRWAETRAKIAPSFVDHSGLGDASRISAQDMVQLLVAPEAQDRLFPIMKVIPMVDDNRKAIPGFPGDVRAKTGTLNFVSSLSGYLRTEGGRTLAFAIFAGHLPARAAAKREGVDRPPGSATYNTRAKRLQQKLLQRWARLGDLV